MQDARAIIPFLEVFDYFETCFSMQAPKVQCGLCKERVEKGPALMPNAVDVSHKTKDAAECAAIASTESAPHDHFEFS